MGRRKNEKLLDILIRLPWSVGVVGAGVILIVRLIWLSWAESNSGMFAPLMRQVSYIFYLAAFVFFVGGVASLVRQWWNGRLLDKQARFMGLNTEKSKVGQHGKSTPAADLDWREFERLVQEAFRRKGYISVETPSGADGGVDIGLRKDGKLYLVQCKHWKRKQVGVGPVRELWGVITARQAAGGFFVISGRYTEEAEAFARQVNLTLIDGAALNKLITEVQRSTPAAQQKPAIATTPDCPKCGSEMVRRVARKGANAGKEFWGCSMYPRCRGVMNSMGVTSE